MSYEDWTADPSDELVWQYDSAKDVAQRYARLRERIPGQVRAIDVAQLVMQLRNASPRRSSDGPYVVLSEFWELKELFDHVRDELVRLKGDELAPRWWGAWWQVRVEDMPAKATHRTGYSEAQVHRILPKVDRLVLEVLEARQMRHVTDGIERQELLNRAAETSSERVRALCLFHAGALNRLCEPEDVHPTAEDADDG